MKNLDIISKEEALFRLNLYRNELAGSFRVPFVKVSKETTVDELRTEKPTFFTIIMAAVSVIMTSSDTTQETNMKLEGLVLHLLTHQIFKTNTKSVELIESLVTLCLWYNFPEWSSKTRYHIFNYICCCLTRDLGPTYVNRSFGMFSGEDPSKRKLEFKTPLEMAENGSRLTLLTYISGLNTCIFLRQSIQTRWSSLTKTACQSVMDNISLQDELYDAKEDETLVIFAKLNSILEKIHIFLHEMDETRDDLDDLVFIDEHIKSLIYSFQTQLENIFDQIPKDSNKVLSFFYTVEAYLHEYVINIFIRKLVNKSVKEPIPEEISKAFLRCHTCCVTSLEMFLKLTPKLVASLPLFHMSRIIYTVGMLLLKLKYLVVASSSFNHLEQYTDGTVELVHQVSKLLKETSKIYSFNNYLYKWQYVVALFAQTYATKVKDVSKMWGKRYSGHKHSVFQLNPHLRVINNNNNSMNNNTNQDNNNNAATTIMNDIPSRLNLPLDSTLTVGEDRSGIADGLSISPASNSAGILAGNNPILPAPILGSVAATSAPGIVDSYESAGSGVTDLRTSPLSSDGYLNEYLTDIDSLVTGFNALNDEFWTGIFNV